MKTLAYFFEKIYITYIYIKTKKGGLSVILRKGNVVCQSDVDLELRYIVEEYLELCDMSRRYVNQYVNSAQDVLDVKEQMEIKRQSSVLYFISLSRWFDTMTLKKRLASINSCREAAERCESHLRKKIDEYTDIANKDTDSARVEIFTSVFVNYTKMHLELLEKQINFGRQFVTKVKKIERVTEKDREGIEEIKAQIVKNEKRVKMIYEQLDEVWTSIPEELAEEIVENEEMKKLKIDTTDLEQDK